jgi:hypothetical protein
MGGIVIVANDIEEKEQEEEEEYDEKMSRNINDSIIMSNIYEEMLKIIDRNNMYRDNKYNPSDLYYKNYYPTTENVSQPIPIPKSN